MKVAKPLLISLTALVLIGALVAALLHRPSAPDTTFTLLDGTPVSLEALRGKAVLVNFWATSCPGCVKEMPHMIEAYEQYKHKGFEIVAVAMAYDPPHYVANFVETRALPFMVALDSDGANARAFGNVQLTPTSFLIGRDGSILDQKLGELDFDRLHAMLDKELS